MLLYESLNLYRKQNKLNIIESEFWIWIFDYQSLPLVSPLPEDFFFRFVMESCASNKVNKPKTKTLPLSIDSDGHLVGSFDFQEIVGWGSRCLRILGLLRTPSRPGAANRRPAVEVQDPDRAHLDASHLGPGSGRPWPCQTGCTACCGGSQSPDVR